MRGAERERRIADDQLFYAEQNARVVVHAEEYYRTMFLRGDSLWNLRDRHMVETIEAVAAHLGRKRGELPKLAIWAHNSHLGDARATSMANRGELNVGQLTREKHAYDAVLVGFTTYTGSVTAASNWDEPPERKRPSLPGSCEVLFRAADPARFLLMWRNDEPIAEGLRFGRLERAIGVIYRPETEHMSHYFRGAAVGTVRRRHPHGRDDGGRATGSHRRLGRGRSARNLPGRGVSCKLRSRGRSSVAS